jgi:23S rRNA (guanine2445-N2)-methyltransferase / 23S rRNA (guanine2069-N7)-methyltransferase
MSAHLSLFASCPKGLEYLLKDELLALGAVEAAEQAAGVKFRADLGTAYRCCLWSRLANRIVLPLAEFPLTSAADLYDGIRAIDWATLVSPLSTFAVDFSGTNPLINNSQFGAQRSKDAVVDRLLADCGERPSVDLRHPDWKLQVQLRRDRITVGFDLCGESLHRRGYRLQGGMAPLKENLAAALLLRADWPGIAARGGALIDPMCGSGTLLIEGALMAMEIAPNLQRTQWAFQHWRGHDPVVWKRVHDEALQKRERAFARQWPEIRGYDGNLAAIRAAEENIERAGLTGRVRVMRKELAQFVRPTHLPLDTGLVICNPPYGERLGEQESLRYLYAHLGARLREEFVGWRAAVFTGNPDLGRSMGIRSHKQYRFWNGAIASQLLLFDIRAEQFVQRAVAENDKSADGAAKPLVELSSGAQMFANRLRKNRKKLQKWLDASHIDCYRLYDADMPEYAVAVDVYADWVHVAEYAAPASVDAAAAEQRLREVISAIPTVLDVEPKHVVLKQRRQQKGSAQYQRISQRGEFLEVREGQARLLVNLTDYLDTGLFLDHRPVRLKIAELARDKRFLNLFCYTATASVQAAVGGARLTTSVDLSGTYLDWARHNFALNGLSEARNHLVQADCREWIRECRQQFDLILLDPPTFSNSKRMEGTLDIQRDQVDLIDDTMQLLAADGLLIFSNNRQKFRLDPAIDHHYLVEDVTRWSLDADFQRQPPIHQCWFIRHRPGAR